MICALLHQIHKRPLIDTERKMKEKQQLDETQAKRPAPEEVYTPEKFATLAQLALEFCDMVIMCAPAFAGGSRGARVLTSAHQVRPLLVGMLAAKASQPAQTDTPSNHAPGH